MCKTNFFKVQDEKRTFQSSKTKIEFHVKFKDENNSLRKKKEEDNYWHGET